MHDSFPNPSRHVPLRIALGLLLVFVLTLTAFAKTQRTDMPRGQKHESRREIDQLEEVWRDAILKGNFTAMDALLADDYMAITASGTLQTREQALANLRSGRTHLSALDVSDRKVRFYGKTALVTSRAHVQGTNAAGDISGSFRYTRVYVRDSRGKWKIVSFETSRIRQPDENK
jgi:ketosteroid isomerase-like protein